MRNEFTLLGKLMLTGGGGANEAQEEEEEQEEDQKHEERTTTKTLTTTIGCSVARSSNPCHEQQLVHSPPRILVLLLRN